MSSRSSLYYWQSKEVPESRVSIHIYHEYFDGHKHLELIIGGEVLLQMFLTETDAEILSAQLPAQEEA